MVIYRDRDDIYVLYRKYKAHVSIVQSTVHVKLIKVPIISKKNMYTLFRLLDKQFRGTKQIHIHGKMGAFSRYLEQAWSDRGLSVVLAGDT